MKVGNNFVSCGEYMVVEDNAKWKRIKALSPIDIKHPNN